MAQVLRRPTDRPQANRAICVPGVGSVKPFSAIMVDVMPDIQLMFNGQCFPRYRYAPQIGSSAHRDAGPPNRSLSSSPIGCPTSTSSSSDSASPDGSTPPIGGIFDEAPTELAPEDNITNATLTAFRTHYDDTSITKDQIFDYIYGVLHAADFRERFANDLAKELPRVPFAQDFHAFADAGKALSALHLGYEHCAEYPLEIEFNQPGTPEPQHFRIGTRKMRFKDKAQSILQVNEHIQITGIPPEAHEYQVNGRTPLGWFMDRYRIVQDKESGIVNDPNGWFEHPEDLVTAIRRIVHVSVETHRIVQGLPEAVEKTNA